MIPRYVRLRDLAHMPTADAASHLYAPQIMEAARAALVARNLRYDNARGIIRDDTGELSRFSNPSDHVPHETLADVMRWEFTPYINNAASRLFRGYPA